MVLQMYLDENYRHLFVIIYCVETEGTLSLLATAGDRQGTLCIHAVGMTPTRLEWKENAYPPKTGKSRVAVFNPIPLHFSIV